MTKLVILDRDGVINRDSLEYIKSPDEFHILPGSLEAMVRLNQAGYTLAVATNQSGISRGYYTETILEAIHLKLQMALQALGGHLTVIEYCLHMPDAGCACRKPNPGMLHTIAKHLGCTLDGAVMVGDRITDILVAQAAGVRPMVVLSSMTDKSALQDFPDVPVFTCLATCVDAFLAPVCQSQVSEV
jgi:D-glycero-D-manno-heptose 1,7-bisphosphate phosphatase